MASFTLSPRLFAPSSLPFPIGRPATSARPASRRPAGPFGSSLSSLRLQEEPASQGLLWSLFAATIPAVAYSLYEVGRLVLGGTLDQAIRAFAS